jgi:hypothetical protein
MKTQMPNDLDQKIKKMILERLNPSGSRVFLKLALIQSVAGFFVLMICPQFHLGFFPHSFLGHILMSWGEVYCNLACGAIFLGCGTFFSLVAMSADEMRVLKKFQFIQFPLLIFLSLISFVFFGVKIQLLMFLVWGLGALVSACGVLGAYQFAQKPKIHLS